ITFLPATAVTTLSVYKEEPAYLYWRLKDSDQTPLKGLRQVFVGQRISVDADDSVLTIPFGTRLVLRGQTDRPLKNIRIGFPSGDRKGDVPEHVPVVQEPQVLTGVLADLIERQRKLKIAAADPAQDLSDLVQDQTQLETETLAALESAK